MAASDGTVARIGRPPKPTEESVRLSREFLALTEYGVTGTIIAEREGMAPSHVYELITMARRERAAAGGASATPFDTGEAESPAAPPSIRKLPLRTVAQRAALAVYREFCFRPLDAAARDLWLRAVMEISNVGDGTVLGFGGVYQSRGEFVSALDGTEAKLDELIRRELLGEADGGGIAMPLLFNLRPKIGRPAGRRRAPDANQSFMLHTIEGGLSDSGKSPVLPEFDSGKSPEKPDFNRNRDSGKTPLLPESAGLAHTADADANAKDFNNLSISISKQGRAPDSGKSRVLPESDSGKTPVGEGLLPESDSGKSHDAAVLTAELAERVKPGRSPNALDLGAVQAWLEAGETAATLHAVVKTKLNTLKQSDGSPLSSLRYFNDAVREACEARLRLTTAATPPAAAAPAPPLSDSDRSLMNLLKPAIDAWARDQSGCPFPPSMTFYRAAAVRGDGALAEQWMAIGHAWDKAGRPQDAKPPDFTLLTMNRADFEERLLATGNRLTWLREEGARGG